MLPSEAWRDAGSPNAQAMTTYSVHPATRRILPHQHHSLDTTARVPSIQRIVGTVVPGAPYEVAGSPTAALNGTDFDSSILTYFRTNLAYDNEIKSDGLKQ